jgi:hypothetical protein
VVSSTGQARVTDEREREIVDRLAGQAARGELLVTVHAQQAMLDENILIDDVVAALSSPQLLEICPEDRRGPSCLVLGYSPAGRPIHLVCTTERPALVLITVYEPRPPKWLSPTRRRQPP